MEGTGITSMCLSFLVLIILGYTLYTYILITFPSHYLPIIPYAPILLLPTHACDSWQFFGELAKESKGWVSRKGQGIGR